MRRTNPENESGRRFLNPASFPIGSPESRAIARLRAERRLVKYMTIMKGGGHVPTHESKPLGRAKFEGQWYAVYDEDGLNLHLYPVNQDGPPLPRIALPEAECRIILDPRMADE
jgi:hypothetical protein